MAEQTLTRLTIEHKIGQEAVRTDTVFSNSFVAGLSWNNRLDWLYEANTKELWLMDHERQLALRVNQAEVHKFVNKLSSEVAEFEADIVTLPEKDRQLSRLRFEQLFERANEKLASRVDNFVAQKRKGEFADIQCEWHDMMDDSAGGQALGTVCLARTDAFVHGSVLTNFFSEFNEYSDIVEDAETGPMSFPIIDSPIVLAAIRGMVAMKVIPNTEVLGYDAGIEIVYSSQEVYSGSEYRVPEHYQRQNYTQEI